jgi:hypothetical protein
MIPLLLFATSFIIIVLCKFVAMQTNRDSDYGTNGTCKGRRVEITRIRRMSPEPEIDRIIPLESDDRRKEATIPVTHGRRLCRKRKRVNKAVDFIQQLRSFKILPINVHFSLRNNAEGSVFYSRRGGLSTGGGVFQGPLPGLLLQRKGASWESHRQCHRCPEIRLRREKKDSNLGRARVSQDSVRSDDSSSFKLEKKKRPKIGY